MWKLPQASAASESFLERSKTPSRTSRTPAAVQRLPSPMACHSFCQCALETPPPVVLLDWSRIDRAWAETEPERVGPIRTHVHVLSCSFYAKVAYMHVRRGIYRAPPSQAFARRPPHVPGIGRHPRRLRLGSRPAMFPGDRRTRTDRSPSLRALHPATATPSRRPADGDRRASLLPRVGAVRRVRPSPSSSKQRSPNVKSKYVLRKRFSPPTAKSSRCLLCHHFALDFRSGLHGLEPNGCNYEWE
mmetsp:Transcript_11246/g.69463  ORF Transcript_11246/g.69463 Transcript_11246/m.69463 type:complete len:245 (+) Transcript_11246:4257-4991(+)